MDVYELNMDGLVGPTHHYAGLSPGNFASTNNTLAISNPAAAAHQGIAKMRLLHRLGVKQAVLPPQLKPNLHLLKQLGFDGPPAEQVKKAKAFDPNLLSACYSASNMWTANAATISPSIDTADGKVHFTPANLVSNLHRSQEAAFTQSLLKKIFANPKFFKHHQPLPPTVTLSDEGAANHSRLCKTHKDKGLHLFVFGKQALPAGNQFPAPEKMPARQTKEASQLIAKNHLVNNVCFVQQNPEVIDQGVFHHDVIGVANESVLLIHEKALMNQKTTLELLQKALGFSLNIIEISTEQLSVKAAVESYLFNSQIVTLPNTKMALIAPLECQVNPEVALLIQDIVNCSANPIQEVHFMDLKQSMRNGGGPACLRLRIVLTSDELQVMHQGVLINNDLLDKLDLWVDKHYRTKLQANDLADPLLISESYAALEELSILLDLESFYPF